MVTLAAAALAACAADVSTAAPSNAAWRVQPLAIADLAATSTTDSGVVLAFTAVESDVRYELRHAPGTLSWGSGTPAGADACRAAVADAPADGWRCEVRGLVPETAYQFQVVAYRGKLNGNAVFSPLSNVADARTAASPPAGPPAGVTDLRVSGVRDLALTLAFTQVDDGAGVAAEVELRMAPSPMEWGSAVPLDLSGCAATAIGVPRSCQVTGLAADTDYEFQLVTYRGRLNDDVVFGPLSNIAPGRTASRPPEGPPGQVTDLQVAAADDSALTLTFTEVDDGAGGRASYDVRVMPGALSWGAAASVAGGTCAAPLGGGEPGTVRRCTVTGLAAGTTYGVQLVAFRGTLEVDAVFGLLSNVASGTTTSATPPPAGSAWPNEPAGFAPVSDQGWDVLLSDGWNEEYNAPGLMTIVPDATAPLSPANVIQFLYPQGYSGGAAPALAYRGLPSAERMYVGLWWRANAEWEGHPAGDNKLAYLFTNSQGSVYLTAYGSGGGAPYELRVYPQFTTSNGEYLRPNVSSTPVTMGDWHRLEWLVEYTGGGRGRIRWWMDGQLMGDHADLAFPAERLVEFKLSPVWGGAGGTKSRTDWFRYDHIRITAQ